MKHQRLNNGKEIPVMGLGMWQIDDAEKLDRLVEAGIVDIGYRHFDVGYTYKNERSLGKTLTKLITSGKVKRDDLFITTKLPQIGMDVSRVEHFLKLSLEALQLDYIDLYLIHFPVGFKYVNDNEVTPIGDDGNVLLDYSTDLNAIWSEMEHQVDTGRVKSIGLSNFNKEQIDRIRLSARIQPSCLQVEIHLYFQQTELLQYCKESNITVIGYGNLGSPGRLSFFKKINRALTGFECPPVLTDEVVLELSKKYGKSPAQIALRFLHENGVICIPGVCEEAHLRQNIDIFDFEMNESDVDKLRSLDKGEKGRSFSMAFFKGVKSHPEYPFHVKSDLV